MTQLDSRSIILLAGLLALMMSAVLLLLRRSYPASVKGLTEWACAPFMCFLSTVLLGGRGNLPDFWSILVGNGMLMAGTAMYYFGTRLFFGHLPGYRRWLWPFLSCLLGTAWFTFGYPSYEGRMVMFCAFLSSLLFAHARLLFLARPGNIFMRLAGGLLVLQWVFLILRLFITARDNGTGSLLEQSSFQSFYLSGFALCILLLTISMVMMATERVRTEFEQLARHDPLTGALMRRALVEVIEQELERCRRHGHPLALLMLDLDHFKAVNDRYGHLTGDRVLVAFVAHVLRQLRLPDRLGRFGGEEFVLLLPDTTQDEAVQVAERIRTSLKFGPDLPMCTVSMGATTYQSEADTVDRLVARADAALYRAKDKGRNRVETD